MTTLPTPVSILESHFQHKLRLKDIFYWRKISDDQWVGFAKAYLKKMKADFTPESMAEVVDSGKIQLYFDYRFFLDYSQEIERRYGMESVLLGRSYPPAGAIFSQETLAQSLAPLSKHLLTADAIFIPDNFYRCFDGLADTFDRNTWRKDPNVESAVHRSIVAILQWLPILASLSDLIDSRAINFMPYYVVPSFPWGGNDPSTLKQMARLDIPPDPRMKPIGEGNASFDLGAWTEAPKLVSYPEERPVDCDLAASAWLNARFFSLDPVFADSQTWRWASGIKFHEETKLQVTSDLISIDILPLGTGKKRLTVEEIASMRKNEGSFKLIRDTLIGCKEYLASNVKEGASHDFVSKTCREYVRDHLDPEERFKVIKVLDNNLFAGTAFSAAVGAAFLTANPLVALGVPLALTPKVFLTVTGLFDPKVRACARLEALL